MCMNPPVKTQPIGFAPILRHYFERCDIAGIIDKNVPIDSRRTVLTHGQASIAMITSILCQTFQLYHVCKLAENTNILNVILPGIASREYFDDRLSDTLDALYKHGLGNLEMLITQQMISQFTIQNDICHNDTTSASVYGNYDNNLTDNSIKITFGYSKKHREDLKQLIWSLSVSSDSAFPLFQQAYSGNTADVQTYVEQWEHLIDLLGRRDFLYVGDSKLLTKDNMTHIHDNEGFFLAPAPMYDSYKTVFETALGNHASELLIPYKTQFNRGFEVPLDLNHNDKAYPLRMIILYDPGLFARQRNAIENRIDKTNAAFKELEAKLNKYNLKTEEAINNAYAAILTRYQTSEFFEYAISNVPEIKYKNPKRGRPVNGKAPEKIAVLKDQFRVDFAFKKAAFEDALFRCGYYPLITNKSQGELSIQDAMMAHKEQYKSEHTFRRAKSEYSLEPIYIHTPERIETFLFLFKIALQIIALIERTARKHIAQRDKGLDNFRPNRKDVRNPKTEHLLKEFHYIVKGEITLTNDNPLYFISELNELQRDILTILEVPFQCFTYEYLFGSGDA